MLDWIKAIAPPTAIFIAGGSGAGKSTITAFIQRTLGGTILSLDDYFLNEEHVPFLELEGIGRRRDWDNPASIDMPMAKKHIRAYVDGASIVVPVYDFATNSRAGERKIAAEHFPLIVEGLFALSLSQQCELDGAKSLRIFVTAPTLLRKHRIAKRDATNRCRSIEEFEERFEYILFGESRWMDSERRLADCEISTATEEPIVSWVGAE